MKLRLVLVSIALGALLSGCVRMHFTMDVTESDTASATIVMALQDDVAVALGYDDPADAWRDFGIADELPEGSTSEPYSADGYTGITVLVPPTAIEEFVGSSGGVSVTREGDTFVAHGELTDDEFAEFGGTNASGLDIVYTIAFPGAVTDHNGTLLDTNTVQWTFTQGEDLIMDATAGAIAADPEPVPGAHDAREPAARSNTILWVSLAGFIIALAGAAALIVTSKKRGSRETTA